MMNALPTHPVRVALLALLAVVLGAAVLWADGERRAGAQVVETPRLSPFEALDAPRAPAGVLAAGVPAAETPVTDAGAVGELPTVEPVEPPPTAVIERRGGVACADEHLLVQIDRTLPIAARPGGAKIATMPATSAYLGETMLVWVQEVSADGAWGRVTVPWGRTVNRAGWISLDGAATTTTSTMVVADLSDRRVRVFDGCRKVLDVPAAVGAAASPSPRGRFWVTDRVRVPANQPYFGSFAFGLSTIQPKPPAGWTGGNQMAIHGTNTPASIGTAASAGCLRVSEAALAKLKPHVQLGTPVIIQA